MSLRSLVRCAFAVSLLSWLAAHPIAAATSFTISMDSSQEVGTGSTSTGTASGTATLVAGGAGNNQLSVSITFDSTFDFTGFGGGGGGGSETVTNLHLHNAPTGSNGGVVFGIISPSHDGDGDTAFSTSGGGGTLLTTEWDSGEGSDLDNYVAHLLGLSPGQASDIYVNLHTSAWGGGSIRGQIVAVPEPTTALMLGVGLVLLAARRHA